MPGIRQDLFPARITIGEKTYAQGRVLVDSRGRGVVWVNEGGQAVKVADALVTSLERVSGRTFSVTTEDGETWEATRSGTCGCGSPLRRISRSKAFA